MSKYSFNTSLGRFRIISIIEGISFLLLLGVAMPLKYAAGMEEATKYPGWAHGLLFVAYVIALIDVAIACRWSFSRSALGFIASLLPFGPFVFDSKVLKNAEAEQPQA